MKIVNGILLFSLIFLAFRNPCPAQDIYAMATEEYFDGDMNKSITLFTLSIESRTESANAYMYRGAAYAFLNDFTKAVADLDSSWKLDSGNVTLEYYYGKVYLLMEKLPSALVHFQKALARNAFYADCYDGIATVEIMTKQYDEAIKHEGQAIQLDSCKPLYFINRGIAKSRLSAYRDAVEDYSVALALNPHRAAFMNRGYAYYQLNDFASAIVDFTNSLRLFRTDPEILYLRGLAYKQIGQNHNACLDFERSSRFGNAAAKAQWKQTCFKGKL